MIIDVGGFNGEVSVKFATAFPDSQIYTFEPIKNHFEQLQNVILPYTNIKAFNIALGSTTEEKQINKLFNSSSSSILEASNAISNDFFATHLAPKETESIVVKRLDDVLPISIAHISILKMDVQGFELQVLKGSEETLKKVYIVVLEMQNHDFYKGAPMYFELDEYLRKQGFKLFDLLPAIRNEMKLYEWDAIYVNEVLVKA
jgi:FkbM family methyltransferase